MNIEQLRKQRSHLKGKLTTAKNFILRVTKSNENISKEEIESRIQGLEETYIKFQNISQQLLINIPEGQDNEADAVEETEFEDRYFSIKALFVQLLERLKPQSAASTSTGASSQTGETAIVQLLEQQAILIQRLSERPTSETSSIETLSQILEQQGRMLERMNIQPGTSREPQVKLPIIKLPTFNGTIEDWKRYADTFKTLIHNSDLSNVQKHQYLVGSLSGPAARIIESIEISDDNYTIAWDLLKKRYEDDKAIRKRHIQCLFEMPKVQRESASSIRELVDHIQKHLRVLKSMKLPTESWGELIVYLVEKNLDYATRRRWEEHAETLETITNDDIMEFLQRRCQVLERASLTEGSRDTKSNSHQNDKHDSKSKPFNFKSNNQNKTTLSTTVQGRRCFMCQGQHYIYVCPQFLNLSVKDRIQAVKRLKLCINCLRNDHFVANCKSSNCRECGERHNTLCHLTGDTAYSMRGRVTNSSAEMSGSSRPATDVRREGSTDANEASNGPSVHHVRRETRCKHVLMSTAIVNAVGKNNYNYQLRVLLDSASEANFITVAACKKLGLRLDNICESIGGLDNMNCTIQNGCQLRLESRTSKFKAELYCLVVPKISKELPSFSIQISELSIPNNINLADPCFYNPSTIDLLIGGELFFELLEFGKLKIDNSLTLQNSKFGWIIAGPIPEHLIENHVTTNLSSNIHTCLALQLESVNDTLSKFWELEEYPTDKRVTMSAEERECESWFVNTTTRELSGRFVVRLPFRKNKPELGDSKQVAIKRLNYLERKFQTNQSFFKQYSDFMREYINLNHMTKITKDASTVTPVYLPHHGVLREASTTTKLRVVFDGSAKTTSGISLNDTLMVGAILQDNIINIILRFRLHSVAITADLKKMYRQILVHKNDQDYQRILWRNSTREPIQEFRLNTVTYGLACAPFLAIRCVRQLASDAPNKFGQASQVLLNDLYVDDILTGVESKNDAIDLIQQLQDLLNSGGFEPHKWRSNYKEILNNLNLIEQSEESSSVAIDVNNTNSVKTLGLNWHPERDIFEFSIQSITTSSNTKREILSTISRLFDPLGLISPILIRAKLIMQETWVANLNWDDPLTTQLQQAWETYVEDLKEINTIQIPRRVIPNSNIIQFSLHGFCDASIKAYGACIYLQTVDKDNNFHSALLCSKSRVAPVKNKTITLPKLELCGAVVLARLLKNVREALKIKIDKIYAWSDSTIAIAWIQGNASRQKTFVSNRVAEIQSIVPPNCWHHVKSGDNPADLISRGTSFKNLQQNKLWWNGPDWLKEVDNRIHKELQLMNPTQTEIDIIESEQKLESRIFLNVNNSNQIILNLLNNYSFLTKLERVLARVFRFINNCKVGQANRIYKNISIDEIRVASRTLIKTTQGVHFAEEIADLKANKQIRSSSKLLSLSPFLDEYGLLRVGGRIQNSAESFDTKHPILLPYDSKFTQLLFEREHRRLLHAGPQALLYAIRERYWAIKGKNMARKVVHKCVTCFRNNPRSLSQIMGQLPADRVTPKRPFFVTGVDYAGPIITLVNRGRGRKTNKSYVALFICFSTRAIHIELVSDLSSNSFIAALRRFVGRRGYPQRIFCDNATNFVGARNELDEIRQSIKDNVKEISDKFFIPNNIDWRFIPPSSPHMGGLWEAGVKSCKFHLKRVIGQTLLTFEELATVLTQIEACLNSRPICQLPSTPVDLQPLTPGHFIIGEALMSLPQVDLSDVPINRLDRWQLIQKIVQDFWRRWSSEYLTSLQSKTKWKTEKPNLSIDDIVIIQDNNLPPLRWKLGRVMEIHTGTDNKVRVVTLKTASGIYKRAVTKLCKLPTNDLPEL